MTSPIVIALMKIRYSSHAMKNPKITHLISVAPFVQVHFFLFTVYRNKTHCDSFCFFGLRNKRSNAEDDENGANGEEV